MSDDTETTVATASESKEEDLKKTTRTCCSKGSIAFSLWPPTQRTRDAVVTRLIETFTTASILSRRYGTIPEEEAAAAARSIEVEAFSAANSAASTEDDGLEILQMYSKVISKQMLDTAKSRSAAAGSPVADVAPSLVSEEVASSVETEA